LKDVKEVEIFVTFFAKNSFPPVVLQLLRDCITSIERFSKYPHRIYIVDNGSDKEVIETLEKWGYPLLFNENPWKNYVTLMNTIIRSAGSDPFIVLHGDMKVTENWLETLVEEHRWGEKYFGIPCCLIPTFLHYEAPDDHIVWKEGGGNVVTLSQMQRACSKYKIPYRSGTGVISRKPYRGHINRSGTQITDDGANIMSFITSHEFFKQAGLFDTAFTGAGHEDNEMGIRALMRGLKLLRTHSVFIHHSPSASAGRGQASMRGRYPPDVFIEKYGQKVWDDMESGQLWVRLHDKQLEERWKIKGEGSV